MSVVLLVLAILSLLGALAALACVPRSRLSLPVFAFGWFPSEHPLHAVAFQALLVVIFFEAVLDIAWTLPIFVVTWIALGMVWERARGAPAVVSGALARDWPEAAVPGGIRVPTSDLVLPMRTDPRSVRIVRDVAYGERLAGDPGERHLLDVYAPARPDPGRPAPILIQVHGGGWVVGHKRQQALPLLRHMAAHGWVCFDLNYRLAPHAPWPAQMVDVKRAIAWIRAHAPEYGADPEFMCITGGSAGGQLAALAALTAGDPAFQPGFEDADTRLAACVPFYGAMDLLDSSGALDDDGQRARFVAERVLRRPYPLAAEDRRQLLDASPVERVQHTLPEAIPPMFVLQGSHDSLVPLEEQSAFVERLRAHSRAPVVYAELPGAHHAFDLTYSLRALTAVRAVAAFLEACRRRAGRGEAFGGTGGPST